MLDPRQLAACLALGLVACAAPVPARVTPPAMPGGWFGHAQPGPPPRPQQQLAAQQSTPNAAPYAAQPYAPQPVFDAWGRPVAPVVAAQGWPGTQLDPWSSAGAPAMGGAASAGAPKPIDAATARALPPQGEPLAVRDVRDVDGGPARAPAPGSVGQLDAASRELESTGSGRLYLLEMYQQALDERDALEVEVGTLTARLEQLQARIAEQDATVAAERASRTAVDTELASLRAENQDLTGRLVTAQIRRLEAEKMLLEARLEQERGPQSAASRPVAASPTAPAEPAPTRAVSQ